jgi:hypothetical protein
MTEDLPHIVYPRAVLESEVRMFKNYKDAHSWWLRVNNYRLPYVIATVGRVIDPATPVVDVSE